MELSFDTVLGKTSCCKNFKSVTAIHFFLRFKSLNRLKNANEFFNSSILYTLQNSYNWTTQTKNSPCTLSNSNTTFIHQQWWYHETFSLTGIQFICLKGPWTRKDRKIKKRRSCNYIQKSTLQSAFSKRCSASSTRWTRRPEVAKEKALWLISTHCKCTCWLKDLSEFQCDPNPHWTQQ